MSVCFIPVLSSILLAELLCLGSKPVEPPTQKSIYATYATQTAKEVEFCALAANIEAYAGKLVKVKAIIGMVIGPTSDGDNLLFTPDCDGKKNIILIEEELSDEALLSVKRFIIDSSPNQKIGRAEVVIVGKIHGPDRFGYLLNYEYAFEIIKVEKVSKVPLNTPWPK